LWQELDEGRFQVGLPAREVENEDGTKRKISAWRGMLAIDERPFVVFAVGRTGTVKIVDVRNYFDTTIDALCRSFGTGSNAFFNPADSETERKSKLVQRVDGIAAAMGGTITAWKDGNRGNWQPTGARLAYSNFRHEYLKDYPITIDNELMDRKFQREGFFGGEISNWFRGRINGPIFKVDVNSLYPSVMATECYPTSVKVDARLGTERGKAQPLYPRNSMALVQCYGVGDLPMRSPLGRVDYPCGTFSTILCGGELSYAVARGRIREWYRWQEYEVAPIFARFVAYWWGIREQAKAMDNTANSMLAKMMMNSLYGRFAQRTPKWKLDLTQPAPVRWGNYLAVGKESKRFEKRRAVAGVEQVLQGQEEKDDTFPAISAFVASFGRMKMRAIRGRLPQQSVISQSTDSLLLTEAGYNALCGSTNFGPGLGQCRLEGVAEWAEITGANHYETNHGVKLAGCPEDREREGKTNRWKTRRPDTTADVIGRGLRDDIPTKEATFILASGKTCREFGHDGWAYI
jgi:hypothetical protein